MSRFVSKSSYVNVVAKLNCDGFEFMVDSTMYENMHKLIQIIKPLNACFDRIRNLLRHTETHK